MSDEKTVTATEGAKILIERIRTEENEEKRLQETLSFFREAQRVAIHEAAIVLKLSGLPALYRLFAHHGITE